MTIHWKFSSNEVKVWFHFSDPSTDSPDRTTTREFGKTVDTPREVYDLVYEEWSSLVEEPPRDFQTGDEIMADIVFKQFEEIS